VGRIDPLTLIASICFSSASDIATALLHPHASEPALKRGKGNVHRALDPPDAGSFVTLSVVLSYIHRPYWLFFTLFVGLNLVQSALTRWCLMEEVLR
jgi:hypothetical protein